MFGRKKTLIKIVSNLICSILLSLTQSACTAGGSKSEKAVADCKSLQIYVHAQDALLIDAISKYNSMFNDVPIEKIEMKENEYEKYKNQLAVSLLAGDGPDIICNYSGLYGSLYKIIDNKVLYDLDELIKRDNEFNLNDYNIKVLKGGTYRGKRYFIPASYTLPLLWTTESILRSNSINIDNPQWTWEDAGKIVKAYLDGNGSSNKYFFSGFNYRGILRSCLPNLVDYSKKKSCFNTPEFVGFIKTLKEIDPSICPDKKIMESEGWYYGMLQNNDLVMVDGSWFSNADMLSTINSAATAYLNSGMKLYLYPCYSADRPVLAVPQNLMGITSRCRYKSEAFRLIKILLSKEIQMHESLWTVPVNNKAFDEYARKYSSPDQGGRELGGIYGLGGFTSIPLPITLVEEYKSIIDNMGDSYLIDDEVMSMIEDELTQVLNNKESAEQAAKALNEKVTLYLNE